MQSTVLILILLAPSAFAQHGGNYYSRPTSGVVGGQQYLHQAQQRQIGQPQVPRGMNPDAYFAAQQQQNEARMLQYYQNRGKPDSNDCSQLKGTDREYCLRAQGKRVPQKRLSAEDAAGLAGLVSVFGKKSESKTTPVPSNTKVETKPQQQSGSGTPAYDMPDMQPSKIETIQVKPVTVEQPDRKLQLPPPLPVQSAAGKQKRQKGQGEPRLSRRQLRRPERTPADKTSVPKEKQPLWKRSKNAKKSKT